VTPYELLVRFPDRSRPFVTHYDGPAARVELSVATVANGVAKAAGLLRDGLGLPPGATVSLDLPRHWQLPVWTLAALSAGARCGRGLTGAVDVRVVGPAGLAALRAGEDPRADEVLVSSCDPFGLPVRGELPSGVLDVGVEARAHPDVYSAEPAAAASASLLDDRGERPWLVLRAGGPPSWVMAGQRLWVDEGMPEGDLLHAVAIVPLLVGGSVVLATGLGAAEADRLRAVEGVQPPAAMEDDSLRD
jgi:uncharacterized protein (TIGR03089 family)